MGSTSFDFSTDVVAVTGAGRGLGRAIAMLFGAAGATVAALDIDAVSCARVAGELQEKGVRARAFACDVSDQQSVAATASAVRKRFGRCDVLVNNAGLISVGRLEDLPVADWDRVFSVNVRGVFLCMQEFGRHMLQRGAGAIVNISSISSEAPSIQSGAYSPSKAAVSMLTRLAAAEWTPQGIRVNAVKPGMMSSNMNGVFDAGAMRVREEGAARIVPAGRIGAVEEIAQVVAFLASDAAVYVSGETVEVDGGLLQAFFRAVPKPGDFND